MGATLAWVALAAACTDVHIKGAWCTQDSDCTASPHICDMPRNACETSAAPIDMLGVDGGGAGDGMVAMCTADNAVTVCTDPTKPVCSNGTCSQCSGSTDDAACAARSPTTPRCLPSGDMTPNGGECVACIPAATPTYSADCAKVASNAPICVSDAQGAISCRACQKNSECTSGICILDGSSAGTCVDGSAVSTVDNRGMLVATCQAMNPNRNGSSVPYCDVSEAVAAMKSYVLVKGSAQPYGNIALTDQTIDIVGPGKSTTVSAGARLYASNMASVSFTATSGGHTVILDGLELGGDTNGLSLHGVACTNNTGTASNATIIVRNSGLHDSSGEAIQSNGCNLTVDANIIGVWGSARGNSGGGINLTGINTSTITNNIIAGNGGLAAVIAGITLGSGSTATIAFNTIVGNTASSIGPAGVDCGNNPTTIASSLFLQNSKSNGSQFGTNCTLSNVVTFASDGDSKGTMTSGAPGFVSSSDYHLVAGNAVNTACCIDKIPVTPAPTTPNHAHDVDLTTRPVGPGYDIGANEVH
ncbi:MAG TPA: hypothetical protein VIA18_04635 [Polyangia bacterium]|nr:hypothetical protein [Polyangia bacterium]